MAPGSTFASARAMPWRDQLAVIEGWHAAHDASNRPAAGAWTGALARVAATFDQNLGVVVSRFA